jgi:hypothetical protein
MLKVILSAIVFVGMVSASAPIPDQLLSDREIFETVLRCRSLSHWRALVGRYSPERFLNHQIAGFERGNTLAHCLVGRPDEIPSIDALILFQQILMLGARIHIQNDDGETVRQLIEQPAKRDFLDLYTDATTIDQIRRERTTRYGRVAPVRVAQPVIASAIEDVQRLVQPDVPELIHKIEYFLNRLQDRKFLPGIANTFENHPEWLKELSDEGHSVIWHVIDRYHAMEMVANQDDNHDERHLENLKSAFSRLLTFVPRVDDYESLFPEIIHYFNNAQVQCQELIEIFEQKFPGKIEQFNRGLFVAAALPVVSDAERQQRHRDFLSARLYNSLADGMDSLYEVPDYRLKRTFRLLEQHSWLKHSKVMGQDFLGEVVRTYEIPMRSRESLKKIFAYLIYHGVDPDQKMIRFRGQPPITVSERLRDIPHNELLRIVESARRDRESLVNEFPFLRDRIDHPDDEELNAVIVDLPQRLDPLDPDGQVDAGPERLPVGEDAEPIRPVTPRAQPAAMNRESEKSFLNTWAGKATIAGLFGLGVVFLYNLYHSETDKKDEKERSGRKTTA